MIFDVRRNRALYANFAEDLEKIMETYITLNKENLGLQGIQLIFSQNILIMHIKSIFLGMKSKKLKNLILKQMKL